MKIIDAEKRICECCMEEHIVQRVRTMDSTVFKNIDIDFLAEYYYCDHAQETFEDEYTREIWNQPERSMLASWLGRQDDCKI